MYKNEDEFVLGQKMKLVVIGAIWVYLLLNHWINHVPILGR